MTKWYTFKKGIVKTNRCCILFRGKMANLILIKNNNILWPLDITLIIFTIFTITRVILERKSFISLLKITLLNISLDTNSALWDLTITRRNVQKVMIQINAITALAPKAILMIKGKKKNSQRKNRKTDEWNVLIPASHHESEGSSYSG